VAATVFNAKALGWGAALGAGWDKLLIVAVTFGLLTFTSINPAVVILGAAVLGLIVYR